MFIIGSLIVIILICVLLLNRLPIIYSSFNNNLYENFQSDINTNTNNYGTTYYKNPDHMTENQQNKFLKIAKFSNMTIGDYINFLVLANNKNSNRLTPYDRLMYLKYLSGKRLNLNDIPSDPSIDPPPPPNAQKTYENFQG